MAASAALFEVVGLETLVEGLEAFTPYPGRFRLEQLAGNRILIDDSYNANPDSVCAAIEVLAELPGPRLLVLGDMGEVGDQGPAFHAEALQHAQLKKIEKVLVTGVQSAQAAIKVDSVISHAEMPDLISAVLDLLPEVISVLVKGSRFMKMEQVVQAVLAASLDPANPVGGHHHRSHSC